MAQLLIEEAFTGGSLITAVSVSTLSELREAVSRFRTRECELRCRAQTAETTSRGATLDALTDEDFSWLIEAREGEQRTLVMPSRGDAPLDSPSMCGDAMPAAS